MQKKEFSTEKLKKLLESHLLSDDEEFQKNYKENPPQVATELQWQPGEGIISELSKKDLIQLASRYANDGMIYIKNILHFELRIERLLTWLCEANGINVKEKFKQDARDKEEQMEKHLEQVKKALESSKDKVN